ncbi:MAG TPA: type II secretion system protein GspC [Myxococcales bacterium]|nr:type II secretion system protein GspC [Myxococcales bacterium]
MEMALQRYSWAVDAMAVVIGAYLAARTVNTIAAAAIAPKPALVQQASATPQASGQPQRVDLDADKLAKLFDVPLPKPPQPGDEKAQPQRAGWNPVPARSSLHGSLVGTAIAEPRQYSLCQLINPDLNETQVYTIGDKYQGARIYGIEKDRVLIDNSGVNEYIDNSASAPPNLGVMPLPQPLGVAQGGGGEGVKQLSENQYVVARSEINNALTNLSDLATKARIVPSFKNGVANGFKLFSIVPDSLYAKIGVQNGDVIRRINGYEMNSPDKALEIYQKLRDASRIEIELERRGEALRKSYSIE